MVSAAVMTAAAGILVRQSITAASILTRAIHDTASVPGTSLILVTGSAAADTSVLTNTVHITAIIAGTVTIFIARSIDRFCIRYLGRCIRFCRHSC